MAHKAPPFAAKSSIVMPGVSNEVVAFAALSPWHAICWMGGAPASVISFPAPEMDGPEGGAVHRGR
jgi:hypothetical protein